MTPRINPIAVREILFRYWDPLNVGGNRKLVDEYDAYVGYIVDLLHKRADRQLIVRYLDTAEQDLGVNGSDYSRENAVEALIGLTK